MKKQLIFLFFPGMLFFHVQAQTPKQLTFSTGHHSQPLRWKGDRLGEQWNPHAALLIPVTIPDCPRTFYMQFDTGSPYTLFYGNMLQAIQKKYPDAISPHTTGDSLINFSFKAGTLSVIVNKAPIHTFDSTDIDWNSSPTSNIIGTIGTDLIDNKVVVIDYPGLQLHISDSMPSAFKNGSRENFHYAMGRILLPAAIAGKKIILYFDTGSSAFELLTNKATCCLLVTDSSLTVRYPVQSWGKILTAHTITTAGSIILAGHTMPLRHATWIEGVIDTQVNQMMKMGIVA